MSGLTLAELQNVIDQRDALFIEQARGTLDECEKYVAEWSGKWEYHEGLHCVILRIQIPHYRPVVGIYLKSSETESGWVWRWMAFCSTFRFEMTPTMMLAIYFANRPEERGFVIAPELGGKPPEFIFNPYPRGATVVIA